MKIRFIAIVLAALLAGCQTQLVSLRPPLVEEGELFLYTRPFPPAAERLSFTLEGVSAVREDGAEFPVSLAVKEVRPAELTRQRFLGSSTLPPGSYSGLALRISHPLLRREEGSAALQAPERVTVNAPFTVQKQKALLLSLSFDFDNSIGAGFRFTPVFTVREPPRPVVGLTGYVTIPESNTIAVFDKQSAEVAGFIATGQAPRGVIFDQQRRRAYVALSGEDAVQVIDMVTGEEVRRIRLTPGDSPEDLALSPDGRTLLSVNRGSNTVSFVDPQGYFETGRLAVGDAPSSVLIDPAGQRGYVFNGLAGTMTVIDLARRTVSATVGSVPGDGRGAFSRSGDQLYAVHALSSYLDVLDPFTLAQQRRYYVGMGVCALKVDQRSGIVYTGRKSDAWAQALDPFTFNTIATVPLGGSPAYLAIDADENRLYAVNPARKRVQLVNLVSYRLEHELELPASPYRLALMGER
ncbi:YncE family protein [Geomonas oryzae]|uniref:YncE family protein n=1 Tax=Geomonas oryzae TaxID=2364273 RepID=UPI00100BCFB1|nr:YncE family protein [Geomonas oryzae]